MTLAEFNATLEKHTPPAVSAALVALWHEARGDWERAHQVAQDIEDATGSWVHAYLHRKEGDASGSCPVSSAVIGRPSREASRILRAADTVKEASTWLHG